MRVGSVQLDLARSGQARCDRAAGDRSSATTSCRTIRRPPYSPAVYWVTSTLRSSPAARRTCIQGRRRVRADAVIDPAGGPDRQVSRQRRAARRRPPQTSRRLHDATKRQESPSAPPTIQQQQAVRSNVMIAYLRFRVRPEPRRIRACIAHAQDARPTRSCRASPTISARPSKAIRPS